jgi:hypothetical protein
MTRSDLVANSIFYSERSQCEIQLCSHPVILALYPLCDIHVTGFVIFFVFCIVFLVIASTVLYSHCYHPVSY